MTDAKIENQPQKREEPEIDLSKVQAPKGLDEEEKMKGLSVQERETIEENPGKKPELKVTTDDPTPEEIQETTDEVWEKHKDRIFYRKFDSDDVIRLRSAGIQGALDGTKPKVGIDMGQMQKVSIVLGIRSCPWFSDIVTEERGVFQQIFNRRMGVEFRRIPTEILDKLFKEVRQFNKSQFQAAELEKN